MAVTRRSISTITFYSLLGVSVHITQATCNSEVKTFLLPFGSFHSVSIVAHVYTYIKTLSTPFWEFLKLVSEEATDSPNSVAFYSLLGVSPTNILEDL